MPATKRQRFHLPWFICFCLQILSEKSADNRLDSAESEAMGKK